MERILARARSPSVEVVGLDDVAATTSRSRTSRPSRATRCSRPAPGSPRPGCRRSPTTAGSASTRSTGCRACCRRAGPARPSPTPATTSCCSPSSTDVPDERRDGPLPCAVAFVPPAAARSWSSSGRMPGRVIRELRGERRLRLRRALRGRRAPARADDGRAARRGQGRDLPPRPGAARDRAPIVAALLTRTDGDAGDALLRPPHPGPASLLRARRAGRPSATVPAQGHPGRRPAHVQLGLGADDAAGVGQQRADPAAGQGLVLQGTARRRSCAPAARSSSTATTPAPRSGPCSPTPRRDETFLLGIAAEGTRSKGTTGSRASTGSPSRPACRSRWRSSTRPSRTVGWGADVRADRRRRRRHGPDPRVLRRQDRASSPSRPAWEAGGDPRRVELARP